MLTIDAVEEIFTAELPGIRVVMLDRVSYVRKALLNDFIRKQVEIGIYTEATIYRDFLSPACSYPQFGFVEVCYELLRDHAVGVKDDLTIAYITAMARHEAHHFHASTNPQTAEEHALNELECIRETKSADPALEAKAQAFERVSPVYKRVYARMAELQAKQMLRK